MKLFTVAFFLLISIFALFASANILPSWVHYLCSQGYDKVAHVLIFGIAFLLWIWADSKANPLSIAVILSHLGLTVELLQNYYAHGRTFSWGDAIANALGILIALLFTLFFNIFKIRFL